MFTEGIYEGDWLLPFEKAYKHKIFHSDGKVIYSFEYKLDRKYNIMIKFSHIGMEILAWLYIQYESHETAFLKLRFDRFIGPVHLAILEVKHEFRLRHRATALLSSLPSAIKHINMLIEIYNKCRNQYYVSNITNERCYPLTLKKSIVLNPVPDGTPGLTKEKLKNLYEKFGFKFNIDHETMYMDINL